MCVIGIGVGTPVFHQERGLTLQIEFPNQSSAVVDQHAMVDPLQLHPLANQCLGNLPAYSVSIQLSVRAHLEHFGSGGTENQGTDGTFPDPLRVGLPSTRD